MIPRKEISNTNREFGRAIEPDEGSNAPLMAATKPVF